MLCPRFKTETKNSTELQVMVMSHKRRNSEMGNPGSLKERIFKRRTGRSRAPKCQQTRPARHKGIQLFFLPVLTFFLSFLGEREKRSGAVWLKKKFRKKRCVFFEQS